MIYKFREGTAGLVDVGYEFFDTAGVSLGARSQANVVDRADGWYWAELTAPVNANEIRWDSVSTGEKGREDTSPAGPTAAQIRQEMDDNSVDFTALLTAIALVPRIGSSVKYRNLGCSTDIQIIGLEPP